MRILFLHRSHFIRLNHFAHFIENDYLSEEAMSMSAHAIFPLVACVYLGELCACVCFCCVSGTGTICPLQCSKAFQCKKHNRLLKKCLSNSICTVFLILKYIFTEDDANSFNWTYITFECTHTHTQQTFNINHGT